jgi:twinkle protein
VIRNVGSFLNEFYGLYERGGLPRGESTGWPTVDPLYTIRPGEWTLVTGIPGHGKSSWLDNVIVNTARDKDWKWLVFSAENQPSYRHAANLASIYVGRPFNHSVRGRMSHEDWLYASAFLDTQVQFLEPAAEDCQIDYVLDMARSVKINALVIDPWNELDHSRPAQMTETEYISGSLSKVRRFAREQNVHVFIVAHPAKLVRQKSTEGDTTVYPVPTPYDVSGSAHWRNKADNAICVWRDVLDPRAETQIHIQKIRFREVGSVGMCKLYYDSVTGQFIDPLIGARSPFNVNTYRSELDMNILKHESELEMAMEREGGSL